MNNLKRSPIWFIGREELSEIVRNAKTFKDVLSYFGYTRVSGNADTLKKRLIEEKIDFSHIIENHKNRLINDGYRDKTKPFESPYSNQDLFTENSTIDRSTVKRRIISENIIPYECSECGNDGSWLNKKMTLILDHINGVRNDNRLENLRFLCPNCNSQTDTYGSKNIKNKDKLKYFCKECGDEVSKTKTLLCVKCATKKRRKVERPSLEELLSLLSNHPYTEVGRMFGVSDNAIRKWEKGFCKE